jgi:hypothetical protein
VNDCLVGKQRILNFETSACYAYCNFCDYEPTIEGITLRLHERLSLTEMIDFKYNL